MTQVALAGLVQQFFTDRLCMQLEASPNTIAGYRDTFRLLLRFASDQTGKPPTKLMLDELDSRLIGEFLTHVETVRGNSARSRNVRLAAIRSFFRYVALCEPAYLLQCQQIVAMPDKRYMRRTIEYLDPAEMAAVLAAPNRSTWVGRRDHALLCLALQTGLRASELINLHRGDVVLGTGAHVRCEGKGRKQRATPLRRETVQVIERWLKERPGNPGDPLFPTSKGATLSRDALALIVQRHTHTASTDCPSLVGKHVSPHVLRHSTAMELLCHGVDQAVIALWLGHESVETTQIYMHADLRLKEQALARMNMPTTQPDRYRPDDKLLAFLESL
jgi:site-specific recombinase XerD